MNDNVHDMNIPTSSLTKVNKKRKRTPNVSSKLWHCRLGHISRERIERLVKNDILSIKSVDGYDSFITFTDDYSRYGYIYPIRQRSEALDKFKIFKAEVENQHDLKIKVVRSDRGGEYYGRHTPYGQVPGPFAKFLQENGIVA